MFAIDAPEIPPQTDSIELVQAENTASQPEYLLKSCDEVSTGGIGIVDPAGWLVNAVLRQSGRKAPTEGAPLKSKVKLIQISDYEHGELVSRSALGSYAFDYHTKPGYLGKDTAIFMAEFEGKIYKIQANVVVSYLDDNHPQCPRPEMIQIDKPSSDSTDSLDWSPVSVAFADMLVQQHSTGIAQIQQNRQHSDDIDAHIGACALVSSSKHVEGESDLRPISDANLYFLHIENISIPYSDGDTVEILQSPQNGVLKPKPDRGVAFTYIATPEFRGVDHATFLVQIDGKKVIVEVRINVAKGWGDNYTEEQYKNICPDGDYWKISPDGEIARLKRGFSSIETRAQGVLGLGSYFHPSLRPLARVGIENKARNLLLASAELNSQDDSQILQDQKPERVIEK